MLNTPVLQSVLREVDAMGREARPLKGARVLGWTLVALSAVALAGYPAEPAAAPERVTLDRDALVFSQMSTESSVVMQLIGGDVVEVEPADTAGEWCKVKEVEKWGKSGYAFCKDLARRRPTGQAPPKATTPPEAKVPPSVSRPPAAPRVTEKPAAKPMAPVTEPEVKRGKRYTVQVAALVVEDNAAALKARLEQMGFRPIIHTTTAPITLYRVYGGEFEKREEAEQIARRLKVDGLPSSVVETEGGKFGPEVGSFVHFNQAIDLARDLQKKNYTPKVVSKAVPTPVHAVRVGDYQDRSEAVEVLEALTRQGFTPVILQQ
jgi:cell division septation protein DedD